MILVKVLDFFFDEEGLTVVEYVVSAGLISLALSGFFTNLIELLGSEFSSLFSEA